MVVEVELKEFADREECKEFINEFIKDKKLRQTKVSPIVKKDNISYFLYVEYEN